jgi:multicomponent Na+:H+ antiporter subunit E
MEGEAGEGPAARGHTSDVAALAARAAGIAFWAFLVWLLLTWTVTAEQLAFGAGVALLVGCALCPIVEPPDPRRLLRLHAWLALLGLFATSCGRVVRANVQLARRIWAPSRPLRSGMIIVPTQAASRTEIAATGLITSLIVDNQITDLDVARNELQYHAIAVPPGDPDRRAESINAPTERWLARLNRRKP